MTQKIVRTMVAKARAWSAGRPQRRAAVVAAGAAAIAAMIWAWWPAGQYQPVRANQGGTVLSLVRMVSAPAGVARPSAPPAQVQLTPGTHLAVAMIPVGGASKRHPALFVISEGKGKPAIAIISSSAPNPAAASGGTSTSPASGAGGTTTPTAPSPSTTPPPSAGASGRSSSTSPTPATAFPFKLPGPPGPHGTQALAENTTNGGVMYDVAYSLVTVSGGAPVDETNSAYALAHCQSCTTVAVSFQVVLVVGQSRIIAPINAAGALNYNCPACTTTAIADQIVVTLKAQPPAALVARLEADLKQLNVLPKLGAGGSPAVLAAQVATVQQQIETQIQQSGLQANPPTSTTASTTPSPAGGTPPAGQSSSSGGQTSTAPPQPSSTATGTSSSPPTSTTPTTTTSAAPTTQTTTSTATTAGG